MVNQATAKYEACLCRKTQLPTAPTSLLVVHTSIHADVYHSHEIDGGSPDSPRVGTALSASTAFQEFFTSASHLMQLRQCV